MIKLSNKTVRQHYVPQFYLKGFANTNGSKYYLFTYNKENNTIFPANIKNIAQENYFYDIDEAQTIEKEFAQFEGMFNKALQKLIVTEDLNKLYPEEKEVLSHFIAIQFLRTKETRIFNKNVVENLIDFIGKHNIPNFKEGITSITEDSLKEFHIEFILNNFIYFSNIMFDEMYWMLCVNYTDTPFWISDNPCAIYNELKTDPFYSNLGLRCKGFQLHFPLSSKLLLILINTNFYTTDLYKVRKTGDKVFNEEILENERILEMCKRINMPIVDLLPEKEFVDKNRVTFENKLQIISSTQFIFSKNDNFKLAEKYLGEYPHYKYRNRKRISVD